MILVVHNAKVGRNPRRVVRATRRLLRNTQADRLALLEAREYVAALRKAFHSWDVYLVGDVVYMKRHFAPTVDVKLVAHDLPWVGPKAGIRHEGRGFALVDDWLLILHRITGGPSGPNRDAYAAESDLIRETLTGLDEALCVGDQNATAGELAAWWRAQGMTPVRTTAKVDHGASRGLKVTGRKLWRRYGSDHAPVVYKVTS